MAEVLGTVASAIQLVDTALKAPQAVTELDDLKPLLTELQKRCHARPLTTALQHMEVPLGGFKVMMDRFPVKFELPGRPVVKSIKAAVVDSVEQEGGKGILARV
ncbi:hypothetical protein FB451DRAFT_1377615 [Mycena latifolia]|nr:hypothetical protein FB451DRAFT_1377615 [Mycena latifolia]